MPGEQEFRAIVDQIIRTGRHGPYGVAKSHSFKFITFSLEPEVWKEDTWPEPGTYVVLSRITKKRAGWRAGSGRFLQPSDEQLA